VSRGHQPTVTTTAQLVDKASAGFKKVAAETERLAKAQDSAARKAAASSDAFSKAMKAQLSASQKVSLAVREQAAATSPLQRKLVQLERRYLETEKRMRAIARAGLPIPEGMAKQAAAARNLAAQLQTKVTPALAKGAKNSGMMRNQIFELGNNMSMAGGKAGQAGNQILSMIAPLIGGGGVAVAMGAVTLAAIGLAKAYTFMNQEAEKNKEILKGVKEGNEAARSRVQALRDEVLKAAQGEEAFRQNQIAAEKEQIRLVRERITLEEDAAEVALSNQKGLVGGIVIEKTIADARARSAGTLREELKAREERVELMTTEGILGKIRSAQEEETSQAQLDALKALRAAQKAASQERRAEMKAEALDARRFFQEAQSSADAETKAWISRRRDQLAALNEFTAQRISSIEKAADFELKLALARDKQITSSTRQRDQAAISGAMQVGAMLTQQNMSFAKAAGKITLDLATREIVAAAAKGAAEAFSQAQKLGPIIGPIAGAAAGGLVFASIMALRSKLGGFATGGVVDGTGGGVLRGGIRGEDSILVSAQQDEAILPVGITRALRGILNSSGPASPGVSAGISRGGGRSPTATATRDRSSAPSIVINQNNLVQDATANKRASRTIDMATRKMRDRGQL